MAAWAVQVLFRRYSERSLIQANRTTIFLHLVVGLLMIAELLAGSGAASVFG
jgi:hypothetical protein